MKKTFRERVLKEGMVDTKKYRYIAKEQRNYEKQWVEIWRIPLASLGTTETCANWQVMP